jgi:hypothetical protein
MGATTVLGIQPSGDKSGPTLTFGDHASSIGDSFIEGHGVCQKGEKSSGCFLDNDVRDRLYSAVGRDSGLVASMVVAAIAKLKMAEQIKEAPELDPFTDLVIDAVTTAFGKVAGTLIKTMRGSPAKTLMAIGMSRVGVEDEDKVKEADEGVVEMAIKGATSMGKRAGAAAEKKDAKDDFEADKQVAMDFLTLLQDGAFQAIKGTAASFGNLDDANRILLFKTLEQMTPGDVEAELTKVLNKYKSSPVSKIGRTTAQRHLEKDLAGDGVLDTQRNVQKELRDKKVENAGDIRDTKLVMRRSRNSDAEPRLYYYKRDYDGGITSAPGGDFVMDNKSEKAQEALDSRSREDDFVMYKEVEPEFWDIAMANNQRAWGVPYSTRDYHDEYADYAKKMAPKPISVANKPSAAHSPLMRTD